MRKSGSTEAPSIPRKDIVTASLIVVLSLAVRIAFGGNMSVEHFDEGVYASNIWFGAEQGYQYPQRHLYAPPLIPFLIEISLTYLGNSRWTIIAPSLLLGALTPLLAWWTARQWFGSAAGAAAGVVAALSGFHTLYSRTALTDAPLCFFFLLAVYLSWESYRRRKAKWVVAAGLATGAAWAIKYNGWLPLAVSFSGMAAWVLFDARNLAALRRGVICWLGAAAIAVLAWVPVYLSLPNGYGEIAENHRMYLEGWSRWLPNLTEHFLLHRALESPISWLGAGLAVVGGVVMGCDGWRACKWVVPAIATTILVAASFLGADVVVLVIGGVWLALRLVKQRKRLTDAQSLAMWMLAAWITGLVLVTPLYRPYPRLTLPLVTAGWLAFAGCIGELAERLSSGGSMKRSIHQAYLYVATVALVFAATAHFFYPGWNLRFSPWQSRRGLEEAAKQIKQSIDQATPAVASTPSAVVYVYGEPALVCHLSNQGLLTLPVSHVRLSGPSAFSLDVYLVVGPHALRSADFDQQWRASKDRFRLVGEYSYTPSDLAKVNAHSSWAIRSPKPSAPAEKVFLYQLATSETE